ncbi:MAG TPA: DNA gyrase subunit A [Fimbriimonadaceae bacterium]|nr:DNA gyrase subunit A [Fimbriimonadaceae bacterium]
MSEQDPSIQIVNVDEELGRSYVNYAMSVIIARALPDVRDGLKPVQRRILYAMRSLNLTPDSGYAKCAKVCGQTSGDFHPHGEQVIYPTLVRMAQPWSLRYPLIQGQGNFGNIDGDAPAAMRYTECRLTPLAMELMEDLDRDTVEWIDKYSTTTVEPTVFPGKFPNLICNGSQGIAVGMATNLPPHNLTEVCNALLLRIDDPESTLDQVMEVMPGPDFPTYGIIMGAKGIRSAYETGRGSIVMQAKTMIENGDAGKSVIVVTEIPYQVNKENLVKSIAAIAKERKFDGILNVQDYSDKRGMRIEVEVRRDVNPNKALNYLLKHTNLRTTFGAIMLSLADLAPRTCPMIVMLDEYLKHRRNVIERRTRYELMRALEEVHINEGYQIARRFLDEVIRIIRSSEDAGVARASLVRELDLSPLQASAILNMPLRRLTQLDQRQLADTFKEGVLRVQNLMDILNDPHRLQAVMREEIVTLRDKYGDERRTKIVAREAGEFTEEDLIPDEQAIISISRDGYIKRVSIDAYRQQKRGGKGVNNTMKADDEPAHLFEVSTHHTILFFTDRGRVYKLKGYEIPESGRYARGMPVINYINIVGGERVTATISVKDLNAEGFLTMITRGTGEKRVSEIKRTPMSAFANIRNNGLIAFDIEEGDELGWALKTRGNDDVILVTRYGQSIRFSEKNATSRSRAAGGVKAIQFKETKPDDLVVSAAIVNDDATLLVVSDHGYGKRTPLAEYRVQGRGGSGILTMNCTDKTGKIVGAEVVDDDDKLLVMTVFGKGIRIKVKEIRTTGRVAQGVKLINLASSDEVRSIARIVAGADDGELDDEDGDSGETAE